MAGLICAGARAAGEFTRDHLMDCWTTAGVTLLEEGGAEGVFNLFDNNNIR